jgi:hypothetical protein
MSETEYSTAHEKARAVHCLSLEASTEQLWIGLPPSAAGPACALSVSTTPRMLQLHGDTVHAAIRDRSLFGLPAPPPLRRPKPGAEGLRRSFHRRRRPTRYSHPFYSLLLCETEHPTLA